MKLFIATVAVLASMPSSRAIEVYVSPGGHDEAAGSAATPVQTLVHARDMLRATGKGSGGVIHLLPGVYELKSTLELNEKDSGIILRGSGTTPDIYHGRPGKFGSGRRGRQ